MKTNRLLRTNTPSLLPVLAILTACLCLPSCGEDADKAYQEEDPIPDVTLTPSMWLDYFTDDTFIDTDYKVTTDETDDDYDDYIENQTMYTEGTRDVVITFTDDTATIVFPDKKKTKEALDITMVGAHVTIVNDSTGIDHPGRGRINYVLRGSSNNGSLRLYSIKKCMVTLDNVSLASATGSVINMQKIHDDKKRMFLHLADGTTNTLCDAPVYTDTVPGEDDKGTIFSEGKIIFYGNGTLHVTGQHQHAIASDDYIRIHSGVTLVVDSAAKDGIHADCLNMTGGLVKIHARKDAIQVDTLSTDTEDGFFLSGGRLLTCSKRAITGDPFSFTDGQFCLISKETQLPTTSTATWWQADSIGYTVLLAE